MNLLYFSYYILLISSFLLSLFRVNSKDKVLFIFPYILFLGIITQLLQEFLSRAKIPFMFIFHIYNFIEYPLYAIYFYYLFNSAKMKRMLIISVFIYLISFILYFAFMKSFTAESFGLVSAIEALFMTSFSLYFYYDLMQSNKYYNLSTYPHFYINTGNLIFFSLSIFAMGFHAIIKNADPALADKVLNINRVSNIIMYALYCIAFSINIWTPKKLSQS